MKTLFTLLLSCCWLAGFGTSMSFQKLCEVNTCWKEQPDISGLDVSMQTSLTERDWIKKHLSLVENILRARSTAHLTPSQRQQRLRSLDQLHGYWQAGNFPINEDYSYRTPIFIDRHDNFCAVGYLVKSSGHEQVSRMIAAKTNLAYVRQMNYPELDAWASAHGFTRDELAWIQPGYPPTRYTAPVGNGVSGEVKELFADEVNERLYVGGLFSHADSTLLANNIAYVTENAGNYTWHTMGTGVNGPVHAIVTHDNKVFVAGSFTEAGGVAANNVAIWDGSSWQGAGCTYGDVRDLVVFNNELYAVGNFDVCAAMMEVNLAKWDGTYWQQIYGLNGHVNTVEVVGDDLVLGGSFTLQNDKHNIIRWNPTAGFVPYSNSISNEVMDIELFQNELYAACSQTDPNDSRMLLKLRNGVWDTAYAVMIGGVGVRSFNTLCAQQDSLMMGGDFVYYPMAGINIHNCVDATSIHGNGNWFETDSTINKMVLFKNELYAGGAFRNGNSQGGWGSQHRLNGIARKVYNGPTSVPGMPGKGNIRIYPNPAASGSSITIEGQSGATLFRLTDITGREIMRTDLDGSISRLDLPQLAAGTYIAEMSDGGNDKWTRKLVIE